MHSNGVPMASHSPGVFLLNAQSQPQPETQETASCSTTKWVDTRVTGSEMSWELSRDNSSSLVRKEEKRRKKITAFSIDHTSSLEQLY